MEKNLSMSSLFLMRMYHQINMVLRSQSKLNLRNLSLHHQWLIVALAQPNHRVEQVITTHLHQVFKHMVRVLVQTLHRIQIQHKFQNLDHPVIISLKELLQRNPNYGMTLTQMSWKTKLQQKRQISLPKRRKGCEKKIQKRLLPKRRKWSLKRKLTQQLSKHRLSRHKKTLKRKEK